MSTLIPDLVNVTIDGRACKAPAGMPLMDVARREGLPIASVCSSEHLKAYGSCRLCMVQVQGQRALTAACTTPVRDGMVVATETPDILRIRRTLLELYLSEGSREYYPAAATVMPKCTRLPNATALIPRGLKEDATNIAPASKTSPALISPSIPRSASCVPDVCARVIRFRDRMCCT